MSLTAKNAARKAETAHFKAETARLVAKRAALKAHVAYQQELKQYKQSKSKLLKVEKATGKALSRLKGPSKRILRRLGW